MLRNLTCFADPNSTNFGTWLATEREKTCHRHIFLPVQPSQGSRPLPSQKITVLNVQKYLISYQKDYDSQSICFAPCISSVNQSSVTSFAFLGHHLSNPRFSSFAQPKNNRTENSVRLFFGWARRTRTSEMPESESGALPTWR